MRGGEGFIICYSVTDRQSFQEAAKFKELIFQVRHTYEIPLVLVGNKIDLEQFRQVSDKNFFSLLLTPRLHSTKYGCLVPWYLGAFTGGARRVLQIVPLPLNILALEIQLPCRD